MSNKTIDIKSLTDEQKAEYIALWDRVEELKVDILANGTQELIDQVQQPRAELMEFGALYGRLVDEFGYPELEMHITPRKQVEAQNA